MIDFKIYMLSDGNNEFKHMLQNFSLTNVITQPADYTTTIGNIDLTNAVERVAWLRIPMCYPPFVGISSTVNLEIHFKTCKQREYKRIITD